MKVKWASVRMPHWSARDAIPLWTPLRRVQTMLCGWVGSVL
jgi:hypothetical protein